jgi:kynureninase
MQIEIKTQTELDDLPDSFEVYTVVKILGKNIIVRRALGNASVEAWDNASVRAWDNASVRAWGNASVRAWGNASVEAWDNASVEAFMNAVIRVFSNDVNLLEVRQQVVIIFQACDGKPVVCDDTIITNKTKRASFNINNFIEIYDISEDKDKLVLYKFVQNNFTDFYTGKIKYKVGQIVECPDWNDDINNECGGGLHLCPTIKDCKKFNNSKNGHALRCEVDIKDIVVHPKPQYPYKVRCRKIKVIEEIKA